MSGRVLVVDDIQANVRLMEARLMAEYFHVVSAYSGREALEICAKGECDIVLLDAMMPEMDGFEVCKRLKSDPLTMHLPIIIVTALDQPEDRVAGLEAGADDFLTKPVNDLALVTRVRSLIRLKLLTDGLRLRTSDNQNIDFQELAQLYGEKLRGDHARVLVVDDKVSSLEKTRNHLSSEFDVSTAINTSDALTQAASGGFETIVVSLSLADCDPLFLCAQLKAAEYTRMVPILLISEPAQEPKIIQALDMGINDYIRRPLERNELIARVRTQVRRNKFNTMLRDSVQKSIEMAVTDSLTGLYNRRYLDSQLPALVGNARRKRAPLTVMICDIDHFKQVNDDNGHDVGDIVLGEFSQRIKLNVRGIDVVCRYGGEEFVIVMPETDLAEAEVIAERLRDAICGQPFMLGSKGRELNLTMSIGLATLDSEQDTTKNLLKRADIGLYQAKRDGRNRIVFQAA